MSVKVKTTLAWGIAGPGSEKAIPLTDLSFYSRCVIYALFTGNTGHFTGNLMVSSPPMVPSSPPDPALFSVGGWDTTDASGVIRVPVDAIFDDDCQLIWNAPDDTSFAIWMTMSD